MPVVVQSRSRVQLFVTACTTALQAPLFFTVSWSLLKFMSIYSGMLFNISSSVTPLSFCLQSFPASQCFPVSWLFAAGGQSIRASASVLPVNIQGCFPLGLTGLISQLSKGLSIVSSSTTIQKHQLKKKAPKKTKALTLLYGSALTSIHDYWKNHSFDHADLVNKVMSLVFKTLSTFVIAFLLRSKHLLISWLQSRSTVVIEPKKRKSVTASTFSPSICHEVMRPDPLVF